MGARKEDPLVILYVEDNDYIREWFGELLTTPERLVIGVPDVAGARQSLLDQRVMLLITDINLPDGSGLDVAREALQQNPALQVIVCSGHDLRGVAESLGPTAHPLRKPFEPEELEELVERIVRAAA